MSKHIMFKFKLVLEDGSIHFVHGLDEDDAIAIYALSGGKADQVADVIPAFSAKHANKSRKFDDEDDDGATVTVHERALSE
jgi:hypothetical protein